MVCCDIASGSYVIIMRCATQWRHRVTREDRAKNLGARWRGDNVKLRATLKPSWGRPAEAKHRPRISLADTRARVSPLGDAFCYEMLASPIAPSVRTNCGGVIRRNFLDGRLWTSFRVADDAARGDAARMAVWGTHRSGSTLARGTSDQSSGLASRWRLTRVLRHSPGGH